MSPLQLSAALVTAGCAAPDGTDGRAFTALTPETHARFPVASGPHAVDCDACHGAFETFTRFTCLDGCHAQAATEALHSGTGDFAYASTACYDCHPDGTGAWIDHTSVFPIAAGDTHDLLVCRDCHRTGGDYAQVTCGAQGCHGSTESTSAHAQVGGYSFDATACLRCHPDSQVDAVASHLPFGISATYKHYRERCDTCHPGLRSDRPYPAMDTATLGCAGNGCHDQAKMADTHQEEPGYAWSPTACLQSGCHANGRKSE